MGFTRLRDRIVALFLAVPLCLTAAAQYPDSAGSDKQFTVTGTVVNSVTGAPVSRAMVEMYAGSQRETMTNSDGQFEFSGLPAGQVTLSARKPGFFGYEQGAPNEGGGQPVAIEVGPNAPTAILKLKPESVISGRITSNGEAVENIPIKVLSAQVVEGRKQWLLHGNAITDDDGEFRIANLAAGDYFLEIGPKWLPGGAGIGKGHEAGYEKTFYPSVPGTDSAAPLSVGPGQRSEAEISVKLEPWYRISGSVKTAESIGNWNANLIDPWGNRESASRNSIETGEFEIRAPEGNYTLRVIGWGSRGPVGSASIPLTVNSDVSGILVSVGGGTAIPVRVKTEETRANREGGNVAPEAIRLTRRAGGGAPAVSMPPVSIWLRHQGFFEGGVSTVRPDESGRPESLAVRDLEPGNYWVEMSKNPPWYVQSAQCGNIDLLRESLTVGSGVPCDAIDIVLRDDGATLTVSGNWEGDPQQGMVVLLPERAPGQATALPLARGSDTEFTDLAPGEYSVLLMDRAGDLEYKNPDAMSGYLSKAARITLSPRQKASVQPELVRR